MFELTVLLLDGALMTAGTLPSAENCVAQAKWMLVHDKEIESAACELGDPSREIIIERCGSGKIGSGKICVRYSTEGIPPGSDPGR
jgi:hypothetical protein